MICLPKCQRALASGDSNGVHRCASMYKDNYLNIFYQSLQPNGADKIFCRLNIKWIVFIDKVIMVGNKNYSNEKIKIRLIGMIFDLRL